MRICEFIVSMFLTAALIAVFSMFGHEPQEQTNGNLVMAVESGEPTPQPTEGTAHFVPEPTEATELQTEPIVTEPAKTIDELAWEVIVGLWGYMDDRWQRLTVAGYDSMAVQQRVNELMEQLHEEELLWQSKSVLMPGIMGRSTKARL